MHALTAIANGRFTPRALRVYLAALIVGFYGLILPCWWLFPAENNFSILTHTFSYLGSWEEDRNPRAWWLFSIAMTAWGLASIPLVLYSWRRAAPWARRAPRVLPGLLLAGCAGIIIVGLFPDTRDAIIGPLRWTRVHYFGALFIVVGFLGGVPWLGALVRRAARDPRLPEDVRRAYARAQWPHACFAAICAVALFFLIRWEIIYPGLKAAAEAEGREFGSRWREAMNTIYSFPLWDNVFVQTLFIYLVWTALALPAREPGTLDAK
ncbi:MAG: hypothetical protein KF886_16290 [Candidatus Hydrogenedentes bacterium]|nr:hypothetical protein [Candidatus Hydrogenedentota bacterium]